jgi:hypothetical protein
MDCIRAHIRRAGCTGVSVVRREAVRATVSRVCTPPPYLKVEPSFLWVVEDYDTPVDIESNTDWNIT